MAASSEDEPFARRWSRLKQDSRARPDSEEGKTATPQNESAIASVEPSDKPATEDSGKKPFDIARLPSIESLTKESDFAAFMRPEVPDALRQQALKRLWALDSTLSGPDWFEMHMVDFNAVPTFPEGLKNTLYQVGKGYIDKIDQEKKVPEAAKKPPGAEAAPVTSAGESPDDKDGVESAQSSEPLVDPDTEQNV